MSSAMPGGVVRANSLACSQTLGVNLPCVTRKWDFSCRCFMDGPESDEKVRLFLVVSVEVFSQMGAESSFNDFRIY